MLNQGLKRHSSLIQSSTAYVWRLKWADVLSQIYISWMDITNKKQICFKRSEIKNTKWPNNLDKSQIQRQLN